MSIKVPSSNLNAISGRVREAEAPTFVGQRIMPATPVELESGRYLIMPLKATSQKEMKERARNANFANSEFAYDTDNYSTKEFSEQVSVDDRDAVNARQEFDVDVVADMGIVERDKLLASHDVRVANALTAANFQKVNRTARYDDAAAANPLKDVRLAKAFLRGRGHVTNIIGVCNQALADLMAETAKIEARLKYGSDQADEISYTDLARILGLSELVVFASEYDTAGKGKDSALDSIWPDDKFLVCRRGNPGRAPIGVGKTFLWSNQPTGGQLVNVRTLRNEDNESTVVRVKHQTDEKITNIHAGYMIDKCVSDVA